MATIGAIRTSNGGGYPESGGAFRLNQAPRVSQTVPLDGGAEVEVATGNPYIVARLKLDNNPKSAFHAAHEACQKALDLLSIKRTDDLSIRGVFDEHILWWRDGSKLISRICAVSDLSFSSKVQVTSMDAAGNVLPSPAPPPSQYHESFRYFRLAQVSDDLVESFRNMYLAFELALSTLHPRKHKEGEGDWLKRALTDVNASTPLSNAFTPSASDIVSEIHRSIYVDVRCALFHAKDGCLRSTPHSLRDREKIAEAHNKLSRVVLLLVQTWAPTSGGGIITAAGFSLLVAPLLSNAVVIVSEQVEVARAGDRLEGPEFDSHVFLPSRYVSELDTLGLEFVVGAGQPRLLLPFSRITRVGAVSDSHLLLSSDLGPGLVLDSLDEVEVHLGLRLRNYGSIKMIYRA